MKHLAILLFLASAAWGQSPPTVTVADTILLGIGSATYNGRIVITAPDRSYNSVPLINDPVTITVTAGVFSVALVPNDITYPSTVYTVTYYSALGTRVKVESWYVPTSATTLKLLDVVTRSTTVPPNYAKLPVAQLGGAGAVLDYCIRWDGVKAIWGSCPTGGAGAVSSVFGRQGAVVFQAGDATTAQVTESGNLYFTPTRAVSAMSGLYATPADVAAKTTGPASAVDGQMAVFNGATGKLLRALTGSGLLSVASGVPAILSPGLSGNCTQWIDGGLIGDSGAPCGTGTGGSGTYAAGTGLSSAGENPMIFSTDDAIIPQYTLTAGAPTGACTTGRDLATDTTNGNDYDCIASAWVRRAKFSEVPAAPSLGSSSVAGLIQCGTGTTCSGGVMSVAASGIQKPYAKKFAVFQYPGSGTTLPGIGDVLSPQGTGTASLPVDDTTVSSLNLATTAVVDNRLEELGVFQWRTGRNLRMETSLRFLETTALTTFVGLIPSGYNGVNATATPIVTSRYIGFRYAAASDTNWRCFHDNGTGTPGDINSGVAFDTARHWFWLWMDDANATVRWYIDGVQVCSTTAKFPGVVSGTNYNMAPIVVMRTTETVVKNLRIASLYVEADK